MYKIDRRGGGSKNRILGQTLNTLIEIIYNFNLFRSYLRLKLGSIKQSSDTCNTSDINESGLSSSNADLNIDSVKQHSDVIF